MCMFELNGLKNTAKIRKIVVICKCKMKKDQNGLCKIGKNVVTLQHENVQFVL